MKKNRTFILVSFFLAFFYFNTSANESDDQVYVCLGKYAKVFHSSSDCRGLNNCKSDIVPTTRAYASVVMDRRPCCICIYAAFGCLTDPTDDIVTFNPYIPQVPTVMLTPEYYEYLKRRQEAEARAYAAGAEAIVKILELIFTRTPQQKENARIRKLRRQYKREENRNLREIAKQKIEIEKQNKKIEIAPTNKRNVSEIQLKNKKIFWGIGSILTASTGAFSVIQSNMLYQDYKTATTQANSIHNKIESLNILTPISFALAGFSAIEFFVQQSKQNKSIKLKIIPDKNAVSGIRFGINYSF